MSNPPEVGKPAPQLAPVLTSQNNPPPPRQQRQSTEQREPVNVVESRLTSLKEALRGERSAVEVTNACLEIGRPALQPTPDMRGDPSNLFNRPSTDILWNLKPKLISNNMATAEEMTKIAVKLEGLGVPTEQVTNVIIQFVCYCASASSSSYQDPRGTFEFAGGAIMADDVLGTIQELAGVRRVCRLYAPIAWNYMHLHSKPPSDWAAMGFSYNTRYAAFDFFDYVENEAAVKPVGGIVPRPTRAEYVAHNTYQRLALDKANNNDTYGNFSAAVTGGRMGPEIERNFNNANNKKQ
uniref:Capsid protein n=1 Tax=Ligustrum virus A TaxID=1899566 RepID=A0A8F4Q6W8_9VIRU|nr:coat protein [Ligustrum virus A]